MLPLLVYVSVAKDHLLLMADTRRFGEVFQFDPVHQGSAAQRQAIRDAYIPSFGTKFHALLHSFDAYYNRAYQRHAVILEIKDFGSDTVNLALAGAASIAFSDKLSVSVLKNVARHEFGHVLDNTNYITQEDRDWFAVQTGQIFNKEVWADAVMDWINGTGWSILDSILLKPVPPPVPIPVPVPTPTYDVQVSPLQWGARVNYDTKLWRPWTPDKMVVHYEGPTGIGDGSTVAREKLRLRAHEAYHIDGKGWLGLAYNYVIGNSGTLYRARGENRSGATSGDAEPDGIPENHEARAYLFLVGGNQQPSQAAKNVFHREWLRWLKPRVTIHSDSTSTSCPGNPLAMWIKSGAYKSVGL